MIGLEFFAEAGSFDGCQAVMAVVEQMQVFAELLAHSLEEPGNVAKIGLGGPVVFGGSPRSAGS